MGVNNAMKIDEDAFFRRESKKPGDNNTTDSPDKRKDKPYDPQNNKNKQGKEMTLAERLGLKEDKKEDAEHIKKRTKEDQVILDSLKILERS